MYVSSYLNLNFDEVAFGKRVELADKAGVDGIEFYGWDIELDSANKRKETVDDEFYGPEIDLDKISRQIEEYDLDLVYMSGDQPAMTDPNLREVSLENIEKSVGLASKLGCPNVNVKAGPGQSSLDDLTQHNAVVESLRQAAPIAEEANVTLLFEPLNSRDAPDHFVNTVGESIQILEEVDSPNVQLLFDIYHEQIMCGDIIRTIQNFIDMIGHVHIADVPTRNEPGTGELNFYNILSALHDEGYDGFIGCEFIPSGDSVSALSDVVASVDSIESS